MPSKSTRSVTGRVSNAEYIELVKMAQKQGTTLSQFVGSKLSQMIAPYRTIDQTISAIDNVIKSQPKPKPMIQTETIPAPPDMSKYYKEEEVYKMELFDKKSVYGKWSNHLAIPKNQINRDGSIFFPINANSTDLLEEFITGNEAFPILYKVVANSVPFIDEIGEQCVTFNGGYNGIRFGTLFDEKVAYRSYNKWYYRYKDLLGNYENVFIKMIN